MSSVWTLGELPKGQDTFTHFTLTFPVRFNGPVQWDGTYMTASDAASRRPTIYRFTVDGSSLTIVGKTRLGRQKGYTNPCIAGNTVIAAYGTHVEHRRAAYWHYPNAGKQPYEVLKGFNPIFIAVGISGKQITRAT